MSRVLLSLEEVLRVLIWIDLKISERSLIPVLVLVSLRGRVSIGELNSRLREILSRDSSPLEMMMTTSTVDNLFKNYYFKIFIFID